MTRLHKKKTMKIVKEARVLNLLNVYQQAEHKCLKYENHLIIMLMSQLIKLKRLLQIIFHPQPNQNFLLNKLKEILTLDRARNFLDFCESYSFTIQKKFRVTNGLSTFVLSIMFWCNSGTLDKRKCVHMYHICQCYN